MNKNQLAELFTTSVPNISMHISNVLKDSGLEEDDYDLEEEKNDKEKEINSIKPINTFPN